MYIVENKKLRNVVKISERYEERFFTTKSFCVRNSKSSQIINYNLL